MRSGPKLKGKVEAPGGHRSANHRSMENVGNPQMRGKAESATQGRTRNHPSVAPIPKPKIGAPVPNSFYANSRTDVHPKFNTKKKHD
jgi:hypothetical protein